MTVAPNRKRKPRILATSVAALLAASLVGAAPRSAGQQFWDGPNANNAITEGGTGTWNSTTTNWTDAAGTTNSVYNPALTSFFGVTGGTVTLGENLSFTNLTFQVSGYTIAGGGFALSPTGTGSLNALTGATATISAQLTGAGAISVPGTGTIILTGANTYSGGTTLSGGRLNVDHNNGVDNINSALGTGTLTIAGGTLGTTVTLAAALTDPVTGILTPGGNVTGTTLNNNISLFGNFSIATNVVVGNEGNQNFTLAGNINLNNGVRTITGVVSQGQVHFTGVIGNGGNPGDVGGVTFAVDPSINTYVAFIMDGANANTYSGLTTIERGAFAIMDNGTLNGAIQGDVLVNAGGSLNYFSSDQVADTSTVTVNSTGIDAIGSQFAGFELQTNSETIDQLLGTGTVGLSSGTLTLNRGNFSGVILDGDFGTGGKLTKTSAGTLTLSGANTYTGATTIAGGTLALTGNGALGDVTAVNITAPTGIFDLSGMNAASDTIGSLAGVAGSSVVLGGKNLTAGGNNSTTAFAGVLSGTNGSFTKTGTGIMTLSGANTYTGATTVNGGTLVIDTGTNATVLNSASALVVAGGGTFRLTGLAGNVRTQTVAGLTINAGNGTSVIDVNNTGITTTLNVGAITQNVGGLVDFKASTGTFGTDAIVLTTRANDASGILGAWATVNGGAALAANNGSGVIVAYTGYTDIDALGSTIVDGTNTNVRINSMGAGGDVALSATTTNINTLTQNTGTASTIDTSGKTLRLGVSGGILITPGSAALTIGNAPNAGVLTAGGNATNVAGEIVASNFNALTINSTITNNGTGVVSLTKTGTGLLTLAGTNTYTGATTITGGTLALTGAGAIANASAVNLTSATSVFDISAITATSETIGSLAGVTGSTVVLGGKNLTAGGNGTSTTFAGIISGAGSNFTKVGTGAMTLTGANTYTGTTTVSLGTLNLNTTGANALSGNVVVNGGNLVLQQSNQIVNTGTLTVSAGSMSIGANTETVAALQLTGGSITGTSGVLTSTTAFDVQSGNLIVNLDGAVGLTKTTAGTVILGGFNTYTGPTTVNGGTLASNGSLASVVTVNNASTFNNNGSTVVGNNLTAVTGTAGNTVSNSGLIQGGATGSEGVEFTATDNIFTNAAGALVSATKAIVLSNATGTNTIVNFGTLTGTGGIAIDASAGGAMSLINAGTINGSVLFGAANDTLTLVTGQPSNGPFNGGGGTNALRLVGTTDGTLNLAALTNFTTLNKLGGGSWSLTGTGTFAGGTTVTGGLLSVQGNLISNVLVLADAQFGGNGIVTGNLTNYGIVNPGNSPGKLVIAGDYTQGRTGTLIIELAGKKSGEFDVLEVGGRANLDGTLRLVRVGKGPRLRTGERLTFLTAKKGVNGEFAEVVNPFSTGTMVRAEVVYEDKAVVLEGAQGSYLDFANEQRLTPNQRVVAGVIDKVAFGGEEEKLVTHLNERPLEEIPRALDQIAPEELTAVYRVGVALADVQAKNLQRRMDDLRLSTRRPKNIAPPTRSGATGPTGGREKTIAPPEPEDRWGTFFTGTGQVTRVGATENARAYDMNTGGLTVGIDYKVTPNFAIGLHAGYANTDAEVAENGNVRINGGKIGAYATYFTGGFHTDAAVSTGYNSYETRRTGFDGIARGRTDGSEFSALLGTGYDWKFEEFSIGPTATLQYARISIDEFTERGSLAALRVPEQHATSLSSTLGFVSAYEWTLGKFIVRPEIRAAWRHEFGDRSFSLESELASGAGGLFTVQDSEVGSDSFLLGAGVSMLWSPSTLIYVNYDGELGRQEYDAHNLSGGVRLTF